MEQPKRVSWDDGLPLVVVFGNEQWGADMACEHIQYALRQAGVNCKVLPGSNVRPEVEHSQLGVESHVSAEHLPVEFSVVVPVFNEEDNVPELYRRLTETMVGMGEPYELIFVNDGSRDQSPVLLSDFHLRDPHVRVIHLARNFGHQRAVSAGLDYARGRAVIVMDADLQDPPEVIPQFIDKWREGIQVVYAVREKRKEGVVKRMAYHSFYLILRSMAKIDIPLDTGDFCLMDRCVVDILNALPERNRFVRGLRSWVGFSQAGLAYERDARFAGKTKYSFRKLVSLALDGLISFSYLPLRMGTMLGFGVSVISLVAAVYYLVKAATVGLAPPGFATQVVLILFLGGVQLIAIGVIGEYMGHVLDEVKHRPAYVVREVLEQRPARTGNGLFERTGST